MNHFVMSWKTLLKDIVLQIAALNQEIVMWAILESN